MKSLNILSSPYLSLKWWWLLIFAFAFSNAQVNNGTPYNPHKPETQLHPEIFWDVMAFVSEDTYLEVKAFNNEGDSFDVNAIQYTEDTSILDVKVIIGAERLPIKLIMETDEMAYVLNKSAYPLKGITAEGKLLSIRALSPEGKPLDIWSSHPSEGDVVLNAISEDGDIYPLFALAPDGRANTLKAIKLVDTPVEMTVYGIAIYAHVKAVCPLYMEEVL